MESTDLTVEILKSIRDEVRGTNVRVEGLREEIRATNARLDGFHEDALAQFGRLERRQADTEIRLATEIVAVAGAIHEVRDLLRGDRILHEKVDDHERRIAAIEKRG